MLPVSFCIEDFALKTAPDSTINFDITTSPWTSPEDLIDKRSST